MLVCYLNYGVPYMPLNLSALITKILTNNSNTEQSSKHKIDGRKEESNIETSIAQFPQYKASFFLSLFAFAVLRNQKGYHPIIV
jgi:hypothetical protein